MPSIQFKDALLILIEELRQNGPPWANARVEPALNTVEKEYEKLGRKLTTTSKSRPRRCFVCDKPCRRPICEEHWGLMPMELRRRWIEARLRLHRSRLLLEFEQAAIPIRRAIKDSHD